LRIIAHARGRRSGRVVVGLSLEIYQLSARAQDLTELKTSSAETLPALKNLASEQMPRSRPQFPVLSANVW